MVGHGQSPGPGLPGEHIDEADWLQQMNPETPPVCPQISPGAHGKAPSVPASTAPHRLEQYAIGASVPLSWVIGASGMPLSVVGAAEGEALEPQPHRSAAAKIANLMRLG